MAGGEGKPLDPLLIISKAGPIILLINAGKSESEIRAAARTRSPGASEEIIDAVLAHASSAVRAAGLLSQAGPNASIDPREIPEAPGLYGNEPEGRRVRVTAQANTFDDTTGLKQSIRVFVDFGHVPTVEEIREAVLKQIEDDEFQSPDMREKFNPTELDDIGVHLMAVQRLW